MSDGRRDDGSMSSETATFAIRNVILPFVEKTREVLESLRELATSTAKELAILAERISSLEHRIAHAEETLHGRVSVLEDYAVFKKWHKEYVEAVESRLGKLESHEPQSGKGKLVLWTAIITALSSVSVALVQKLGG